MSDEPGAAVPEGEEVQPGPEPTEQATEQKAGEQDNAGQPETEATKDTEDTSEQEKRKEALSRSQRRTLAYHRAKAENYELKEHLAQIRAEMETLKKGSAKGPPKESDYPEGRWDPKYIEDAAKHHAQSAVENAREQWQREEAARLQRERTTDRLAEFSQRAAEAIPELSTLAEEYTAGGGQLSDAVKQGLARLKQGPKVLEHILRNPELADDLNEMEPFEAAIQLGELNRLVSLPQPKTQTQAPKPMTPLSGGSGPPRSVQELAKADDLTAYMKFRDQQEKDRKR